MYANDALLALSSHLVRIPSHIFIVLLDSMLLKKIKAKIDLPFYENIHSILHPSWSPWWPLLYNAPRHFSITGPDIYAKWPLQSDSTVLTLECFPFYETNILTLALF